MIQVWGAMRAIHTCLGILVTFLNLLCANGFSKAGLKRKVLSIVFPLRRTAVVIQCDACSNAGIGVGRSAARRSRTPALWCRGHRLGQPPTVAYRLTTTTVISSRRRAGAWFGEGGRAQEKLWFIALEFRLGIPDSSSCIRIYWRFRGSGFMWCDRVVVGRVRLG